MSTLTNVSAVLKGRRFTRSTFYLTCEEVGVQGDPLVLMGYIKGQLNLPFALEQYWDSLTSDFQDEMLASQPGEYFAALFSIAEDASALVAGLLKAPMVRPGQVSFI